MSKLSRTAIKTRILVKNLFCIRIIAILFVIGISSLYFVDFNLSKLEINLDKSMKIIIADKKVTKEEEVPDGFLVYNDKCRIQATDPLGLDVIDLFHKVEYEPCSTKKPLTSIDQNFEKDIVWLVVHEDLRSSFNNSDKTKHECYYQGITRAGVNENADREFALSDRQYFNQTVEIPPDKEFILVQCFVKSSNGTEETVYINAHATVRRKPEIQEMLENFKKSHPSVRPLSVMILGIDSISRMSLNRSMPLTAQHLKDNKWLELQGYNKIDDNTFPNLIGFLGGLNYTYATEKFDVWKYGDMDKYPLVFKRFSNHGFVTALAEDDALAIFNLNMVGFIDPPTQHYVRPFQLAAEKYLPVRYENSLKFCLGFQPYADYVYQYAMDFGKMYKNDPFFGFFWLNSFSHNGMNDPSAMDERIKYYLEELEKREILENSAVIFMSDHGVRYGPIRETVTGWYEERLPYLYIWLPTWFKEKHPEVVESIKLNKNRLTNPFDIHNTFNDIIELSGRAENLPKALSCPGCQSIFKPVPWSRSCDDISINAHWCTCTNYSPIDSDEPFVAEVAEFVISELNRNFEENARDPDTNETLCVDLHLESVMSARIVQALSDEFGTYDQYSVMFIVNPSDATFESTVKHYLSGAKKFEIAGSVSRLNMYWLQSHCVYSSVMKKYCYCKVQIQ